MKWERASQSTVALRASLESPGTTSYLKIYFWLFFEQTSSVPSSLLVLSVLPYLGMTSCQPVKISEVSSSLKPRMLSSWTESL